MSVKFKSLQPTEVVSYFQSKGYRISFGWQDVAVAEHAQSFTVAKVMRLDILEDIRAAMSTAIADGTTFETFQKELAPKLKAKGWWGKKPLYDPLTGKTDIVQLGSERRLRIIFDANMRSSYAAGHWMRIQRVKRFMPYLRYVVIRDSRTRPLHKSWHGTILPVDDPTWDWLYPPNGWRCRCTVQQLSGDDLKRRKEKISKPVDPNWRSWTNQRTGEVHQIPTGVDPGWQGNVGKVATGRFPDPAKYTGDDLGHEAAKLAVQSPHFKDLFDGVIEGTAPVGRLDSRIDFGFTGRVARIDISTETLATHIDKHRDVKFKDYKKLPEIIEKGRVFRHTKNRIAFVWPASSYDYYRAGVKITADGQALFALTLIRTNKKTTEKYMAKHQEIYRKNR